MKIKNPGYDTKICWQIACNYIANDKFWRIKLRRKTDEIKSHMICDHVNRFSKWIVSSFLVHATLFCVSWQHLRNDQAQLC